MTAGSSTLKYSQIQDAQSRGRARPKADGAELSPAARLANEVPFAAPEQARGIARAKIEGRIPDWLRGTLLRTAPSFGASLPWEPAHWFDALGLVFTFDIGGPDTTLRWSRIESEAAHAARSGRMPMASFASPNGRSPVSRLFQPIPKITDNPNVNIVKMGSDWVALTESPHQWVLDPATLHARARRTYDDELGSSAIMLAHPIISGDGTITNLAYRFGPKAEIALYTHHGDARVRNVLGTWKTAELPYLHSFGATDRAGIVIGHPFTLRPWRGLWSNVGTIDLFEWKPEHGTRLVVIDRAGGRKQTPREYETDACFVFHVVHAFETPNATVIDLLAHDTPEIVKSLSTESLALGASAPFPELRRISIDRATGKVRREVLSDAHFEFPQMDWERAHNRAPSIVFGAAFARENEQLAGHIVAVDLPSGAARTFREGDWIFGEPVFVGKPGREREGDGVLIAVASGDRGSALFVLDAITLDVLARAEFAYPLPQGFHGNFIPR